MPLFWLSLCFLAGIWLGSVYAAPVWGWVLASLLPLLFLWVPSLNRWLFINHAGIVRGFVSRLNVRQLRRILRPLNRMRSVRLGIAWPWLAAVILLGAARYSALLPLITEGPLAKYNDREQKIALEGVVVAYPDTRDQYIGLIVQVDRVQLPGVSGESIEGWVLARLGPGDDWHYGDRVKLEGYLVTPREDETFSYRDYLGRQGIGSLMVGAQALKLAEDQASPILAALYAFRDRSRTVLYQMYPDPEASLLAGILLGLERGIPEDLVRAFQATGTAHIVAISG